MSVETRRLGRIGHMSSVIIFGAASLSDVSQEEADASIQFALDSGINHFDTAASYGESELRLGPWMPKIRNKIFLATKTGERTRDEAMRSIERSLKRLQVDSVDLMQLHAVTSFEELDQCTRKGGALEAAIAAKEQGMVKHIGITGHGHLAPKVHLEALRRYPFETVLTPYNFILYNNPEYRQAFDALVEEVKRQDVGLMTIKAIARGPWPSEDAKKYATWYEPFDDQEHIDRCVSFVLSRPEITGLASAGDVRLLPKIVEAYKRYRKLSGEEQEALMATAGSYASPFGPF
ncbi:aldo/keto reductase [Alicyclobacillus cellulosilyticus]|uniref:aldo/keto reductase n=1 Tax=Alicyclobacillus cellulosilyticus TaxID=1003997 RepID=UPI001E59CC39|nr:aldo/keto reductase [Alicyclobacillus cellulosilyticus]